MNDYSRKMLKVPTYNLLREQDMGKLPVLDVRNLGIDFGGLTAVNDLNMQVYDGEIVGTADLIATASVTRSEFLHVLKQIKDFTSGRFFRATIVFILLFSVAYVLFEAHRREMQMRRRF